MIVRRLDVNDSAIAAEMFSTMAAVFGERAKPLSPDYLSHLLSSDQVFWGIAAIDDDGEVVGGLTAYMLPMTTSQVCELFLYDIAVREDSQRRGIGRALIETLRHLAKLEGCTVMFVPADNDDGHALDFYRAIGGEPAPVTVFTFQ